MAGAVPCLGPASVLPGFVAFSNQIWPRQCSRGLRAHLGAVAEAGRWRWRYSWDLMDCGHLELASSTGGLATHQIWVADHLGDLHLLVILELVLVERQMRDQIAAREDVVRR